MSLVSKAIFFPHEANKSTFHIEGNQIEFPFTGNVSTIFVKQGKYKFEAYGASGGGYAGTQTTARNLEGEGCISQDIVQNYGGNTECVKAICSPGSGGYVSGIIVFPYSVIVYIYVGGEGKYSRKEEPGGFNGGGSSYLNPAASQGIGSGGGATDFRVISDSLYHRIMVAGGGGGADNYVGTYLGHDDGSGGSGGFPSQGLWEDGKYKSKYEVNTTHGFTFGQGQRGQAVQSENPGAGGGFFGGWTHESSTNAGGGGGSSFAFSHTIEYPKGKITSTDENGNFLSSQKYAFSEKTPFSFTDVHFATGIRSGDGLARIEVLEVYNEPLKYKKAACYQNPLNKYNFFLFIVLQIIS